MKILTAQQTREADAYTIKHEPIKSTDLMERAATKCTDWIISKYDNNHQFTIFCGVGNNGGDGLVIAQQLHQKAYQVKLYIVQFSEKYSSDFTINFEKVKQLNIPCELLTTNNHNFNIEPQSIIVDAIFGSGLTRPVDGYVKSIIQEINSHENKRIAIDLPSGLFSESNEDNDLQAIIKANFTLTFQQPKLAMMFPQNYSYVGDFIVLNIGLNKDFINELESSYFYLDEAYVKNLLHARSKFAHKGSYGHALIIAGSEGKMGAEILAARACLRTGTGLLTVQLPKKSLEIIQIAVPEAMCLVDDSDDKITTVKNIEVYDAIGIGPGLGKAIETQQMLKIIIQNIKQPLVLDADALNILSENLTWLAFLPPNTIITPHPKEFERLVGKWSNDEERLQLQKELAIKNNIIVVLKGANTSIAMPDGFMCFNSTGNPGMATGGSGDVLTGIITSLLAQGYSCSDAACFGVYIHGLAGDLAKINLSENAMIASDIIEYIPNAYKELEN
jgi:NAD(P)H-hydrate epimerase